MRQTLSLSAGHERPRVLIAGGGVGGLETLLALRHLVGPLVEIALLAAESRFVYRPVTVGEAFDLSEARSYPLAFIAAKHQAELVSEALVRVDPGRREVLTDSGERLGYDKLVVATGARSREPLADALTFRGRDDAPAVRRLLEELTAGEAGSVAFGLPSGEVWPLPLYELALMTAEHLRRGARANEVPVTVVTPEAQPLEVFGPAAARAVRELLNQRAIEFCGSSTPVLVRPGRLVLAGGGMVRADRVVTLPVPDGPALAGLPHDQAGFIPVDEHGRVRGVKDAFAVGDVTTFPLKQGGLAAQQADAAAAMIAAELGAAVSPDPFRPVLRALLLTGELPLYLRADLSARADPVTGRVATGPRLVRTGEAVPPGSGSVASAQRLWWPPAKIAGRFLAPYLWELGGRAGELSDRPEIDGPSVPASEQEDAAALALSLAELDAKWGDYRGALEALEAVEAARGALPPEYEARRREWRYARFARV